MQGCKAIFLLRELSISIFELLHSLYGSESLRNSRLPVTPERFGCWRKHNIRHCENRTAQCITFGLQIKSALTSITKLFALTHFPLMRAKLSVCKPFRHVEFRRYIFTHLNLSSMWGWMASFTHRSFYPQRVLATYWSGVWVGLRGGTDALKKNRISCLCRECNHDYPKIFIALNDNFVLVPVCRYSFLAQN
jgi:hypothetical protein